MPENHSATQELTKGAASVVGHVFAIVAGLVLMIVGLAMGVSIVLLPFGVPLGLLGVFVFLWGCFGRAEKTPPGPVAGP
jgi:hypothetical protein